MLGMQTFLYELENVQRFYNYHVMYNHFTTATSQM